MGRSAHTVGWRERSLALASLGCAVLLTASVVVFAVRNLGFLVAGLVGVALMVSGAWWGVITERAPRRNFVSSAQRSVAF